MTRQSGFIQLPILGWAAAAGAVAILALSGAVWVQTARLDASQARYATFRAGVEALGKAAVANELLKEKSREQVIAAAVSARDIALAKLRQSTANPRSGFVSPPAASPTGDTRISYDRAAIDAALRRLDSGVSEIVGSGDTQLINAQSLLSAWPK